MCFPLFIIKSPIFTIKVGNEILLDLLNESYWRIKENERKFQNRRLRWSFEFDPFTGGGIGRYRAE